MDEIKNILQHQADRKSQHESFFYKGEMYEYYDEGLTRHVFANADKSKVIKLLIDQDSKDFNEEEAEIYKNASDKVKAQMAKTKLTGNGMFIEQEFCLPIDKSDKTLTIPQMMFASSCRDEVGWNSEGELVCFDLDEYKKY